MIQDVVICVFFHLVTISTPKQNLKMLQNFVKCICAVSGLSDLRRRGRRLLPGGVGAAEPCSAESVQDCCAGELLEPGLSG